MKKSKLMKIFLIVLVSVALVFMTTSTFAADGQLIDITDAIEGNNTNGALTNTNTNGALTNSNTAGNLTNSNTAGNLTNSNANNGNTNISSYDNTNLPKTGIAGTGSMVCLIVLLAVSAVYAFKKVNDYNNI